MQLKINEKYKDYFKGKKYNITTFGCQMNEHDSERISYILEDLGYTLTDDRNEADFILFNTCLVRENAELKLYGQVSSLKKLKEENPEKIIAVSGCMMQTSVAREVIEKKHKEVDIIFGTKNINSLPDLLFKYLETGERVIDVSEDNVKDDYVNYNSKNNFQAYVNIMTGCDNFCSYCIVPQSRGREESRRPSHIIEEIENLVNNGYKEITLLGQNVNSYGNKSDFNVTFPELLEKCAQIKGLERLRFTTSHPKDLSDDLIRVIKENDNICNYFHLPMQSGSDKVLKDMNRKYNKEQYLEKARKLREEIPNIAISTDIIVGYPTETEEDFQETLDVCRKVGFDTAFTFKYSPRPKTKAAKLETIDEKIVQDRFDRLLDTLYPVFNEKNKEYVGKVVEVLLESESKNNKNVLTGRTDTFKLVHVEADKKLIGQIVKVKITDNTSFTISGHLV
ncbi:tRNA (N6-isopentenyl adenosine(37)-C2)-methylthiotransferase MiaB [Anaerococcus hydrogenalis]|uniref:tRNA-2-methylthio-N(6)-dimethylallyladenosine synthase n=1 Tax=Anaerococcus hydrogenalis ACS-025-V-Sch4 TaxID=879306 RepID=F0GZQ4_9FIRM|nr:tRNA (N6-isopentenyl adenosine(37)-C2)-methylthiotransferase MiaB [Anaerococcus hydrogenalis]EGC84361.1 tRNA-i(6)A37 thiotransferase enzyme MiaB [Anaerococcus hydrogenalis ACS-025-V-Sch4]MBS5988313.1 tRNA (N6-isopentenyl adenosine(37)-C2)-methylthiotransferase MiaB [Anaerococcus hydrogenalis]